MVINRTIATLMFAAVMGGCSMPGKQVYVASDTSLGLIGSMNTAQTAGKMQVGYDRTFVSLVPKKTRDGDAMSTYNCTHLEIKGLRIAKFHERIATGQAAKAIATSLAAQGSGSSCAMK